MQHAGMLCQPGNAIGRPHILLHIFRLFDFAHRQTICAAENILKSCTTPFRKNFLQHNTYLPAQMTVEVDTYSQKQLKALERKHSKLESSIHLI